MPTSDLAPGLLLAAPDLCDPNFQQTVVLLGHHDEQGALGWVINGATLMPVDELLRASGLLPDEFEGSLGPGFSRLAQLGGPVDPVTGWIVYRHADYKPESSISLGAGLGITGDSNALLQVMKGEGPKDFRLLIGYSGWGPGQLEKELREGSWLPAAVDAALVFDTPNDKIWEEAYVRSVGTGPGAFAPGRRGRA